MTNIKEELKSIIITGLRLTEMKPSDLADDQKLLGGDLDIDSIDILQLVLEIERHFGIKLVEGEFDENAWQSIETLAQTVESKLSVQGSR
jgi:acyl carrier protein